MSHWHTLYARVDEAHERDCSASVHKRTLISCVLCVDGAAESMNELTRLKDAQHVRYRLCRIAPYQGLILALSF